MTRRRAIVNHVMLLAGLVLWSLPASLAAQAQNASQPVGRRAAQRSAPASARTLLGVEVSESHGGVVVQVRADGTLASVVIFPLRSPDRLVIDLPGVGNQVPARRIAVPGDHIARVRVGSHPDKTRIVLDAGPAANGFRERRVIRTADGFNLALGPRAAAATAATSGLGVALATRPPKIKTEPPPALKKPPGPEPSATTGDESEQALAIVGDGAPDPELDDALGGFDDDAADSELDDALGGFGEDEPRHATAATDLASTHPEQRRSYDLTGSVSLGSSLNLRSHYASVNPDPAAQNGTPYGNVQRLRLRGDLQLDLHELPFGWRACGQAFAFYDLAYALHGRSEYTRHVLEDYEYQYEVLDLWLAGPLLDNLDLKVGRQVVNWGRSDTLRVTDVLNPLNNREPGLVDIEDLRLPVTMVKADYYWRQWSFTALLIPEIRYDYNPAVGSDFYPSFNLSDLHPSAMPFVLLNVAAFQAGVRGEPASRRTSRWRSPPEYGGAITGIFSGWDISLYAASTYQNQTTVVLNIPDLSQPIFEDDDRVTMVGAGGNYTLGSWLFKAELAYLDDLHYAYLTSAPGSPGFAVVHRDKSRLDVMGGVEYYGFHDTTIALEIVNRHLFDYDPLLKFLPNYLDENSVEMALRITKELMNSRLDLTALGLVLGERAQHGATIRLSADYELIDALVLSGGLLYFVEGDKPPLDGWGNNDRLFMKIKYSF